MTENKATVGLLIMCLAIPGKILEIHSEHELRMGKVDFGGVCKRVCLEHVPEAAPGDYVLVHVGFALALVDEEEARRVFQWVEAMGELEENPGEINERSFEGDEISG